MCVVEISSAAPKSDIPHTTWLQIEEVIRTGRLEHFKRHPRDQSVYETWCAKTRAQHGSVEKYLLKTLCWESNQNHCPTTVEANSLQSDPTVSPVLRLCDFPYHLEPGIRHLLLWCPTVLPEGDLAAAVFSAVDREEGGLTGGSARWEILWFVNPTNLQSVRGISHVHVMAKERPMN